MAKRLRTPADVRRYLASLINDLADDHVDPKKAGRLAYVANILVRTMEVDFQLNTLSQLSNRLDEIEARLGQ